MQILGISALSHDTSAALIRDGEVVACVEEERFVREKHTEKYPARAIQYCLEQAGGMDGIDGIALAYSRHFLRNIGFLFQYPRSHRRVLSNLIGMRKAATIRQELQDQFGMRGIATYVDHHFAHLASAFYPSSFERAAILSIDGFGGYATARLGLGTGRMIKGLRTIWFPHSIGCIYSSVTQYLGFKPDCDEGKVMGLAPYGEPAFYDLFQRIVRLRPGGRFWVDMDYFLYHEREGWYGVSEKFVRACGPPRKNNGPIEKHHRDVAASLQKLTEEVLFHVLNYLHGLTGERRLCLAGGVALNSVANGMIFDRTPFAELFVQPAAGDAGLSIGAALALSFQMNSLIPRVPMAHPYLGPDFDDAEIEARLRADYLKYEFCPEPAKEAALLLSKGNIIGWFQGRMEIGPRALGGRSILADPRDPYMKDRVNNEVKHREPFRPFAPSILEERIGDYFVKEIASPYMLTVFHVRTEKRDLIPAVVHVDGTGRVQSVSREANPLYWSLIREFEELTGVPVVLNTSFNVKGEPIVCTPNDAIRCFYSTGLTHLIMGHYLLKKM